MRQVYKIKKALIAPMILAVLLSVPVFVDTGAALVDSSNRAQYAQP